MGIQQPVKRDITDFDPGLKQHVLAGQEYIRYYISTILQFQFLAALCPTNQIDCDIQQNENAFRILYPMMNKGSTQVKTYSQSYNEPTLQCQKPLKLIANLGSQNPLDLT